MTAALLVCGLAGVVSTLLVTVYAVRFSNAAYVAEGQAMAARTERDGLRRQVRDAELRDRATQGVIRTLQQQLREQIEIARVATDAGQSLAHEHARLIAALQEACAWMVGGRDERERIASLHRLDFEALGHGGAASALANQWHGLIAECEAGAGHESEPLPPPPPLDQRHLRVVGGTAARPATAADVLNLTGPVGA